MNDPLSHAWQSGYAQAKEEDRAPPAQPADDLVERAKRYAEACDGDIDTPVTALVFIDDLCARIVELEAQIEFMDGAVIKQPAQPVEPVDDLVERLRSYGEYVSVSGGPALKMRPADCVQAAARIEALEADLAAARADAERYRWLRQYREGDAIYVVNVSKTIDRGRINTIDTDELDAAIDAARKGTA